MEGGIGKIENGVKEKWVEGIILRGMKRRGIFRPNPTNCPLLTLRIRHYCEMLHNCHGFSAADNRFCTRRKSSWSNRAETGKPKVISTGNMTNK